MGLKGRCHRALLSLDGLGENLSLAFSSFWWLVAFLRLWLMAPFFKDGIFRSVCSVFTLPSALLYVSVESASASSYKDT